MKKILLASTALVATAGVAAADINLSGLGRVGILYDDSKTATGSQETIIDHRFRLNIDGDATTDAGVRFSARLRIEANDGGHAPGNTGAAAGLSGGRVSAEYEGFRLDVGNAGGAWDNLPGRSGYEPGLLALVGQTAAIDFSADGFSSTGAVNSSVVYFRYATGAWAVSASYSDDTSGSNATGTTAEELGVHVAYSGDNWAVALGYAQDETAAGVQDEVYAITGNYDFGQGAIGAIVGSEDLDSIAVGDTTLSDTFYGLSVSWEVGAGTNIIASYGDGSGTSDTTAYGIGFTHDLGGGVTFAGGIANSESGAAGARTDATLADLGVVFNF